MQKPGGRKWGILPRHVQKSEEAIKAGFLSQLEKHESRGYSRAPSFIHFSW